LIIKRIIRCIRPKMRSISISPLLCTLGRGGRVKEKKLMAITSEDARVMWRKGTEEAPRAAHSRKTPLNAGVVSPPGPAESIPK
jgi:hypothetical protein